MVALTMTTAIVTAVREFNALKDGERPPQHPEEPSLQDPQIGSPITYGQLIDLSKCMEQAVKDEDVSKYRLGTLLRGSQVYTAPRQAGSEHQSCQNRDYKELMARLRREEEDKAYRKMINSSSEFQQSHQGVNSQDEEDEMTYSDVNRQMTLIFNVLVSIIACSIAIWLVARHMNTPARLALSLTGSGVVGAAEVTIYFGYIRRLKEARGEERAKKEERVVTETWVIEANPQMEPLLVDGAEEVRGKDDERVRRRRVKERYESLG